MHRAIRKIVAVAILAIEILAGGSTLKAIPARPMPCCPESKKVPVAKQAPCCCCVLVPGLPTPPASAPYAATQSAPTPALNALAADPLKMAEMSPAQRDHFAAQFSPPGLYLLNSTLRI
jgi:hypothetical protein